MNRVKYIPNDVLLPQVRKLLQSGKHVTISVRGSSMLPFITGGRDSVMLERCAEPKTGDILLCEIREGEFVLHRAISVKNGKIVLMGDGRLEGTEICGLENVAGKVVRIIRPGGKDIWCDSRSARFYSRIWRLLLPFRHCLLAIHRKTASIR